MNPPIAVHLRCTSAGKVLNLFEDTVNVIKKAPFPAYELYIDGIETPMGLALELRFGFGNAKFVGLKLSSAGRQLLYVDTIDENSNIQFVLPTDEELEVKVMPSSLHESILKYKDEWQREIRRLEKTKKGSKRNSRRSL